MQSYMVQKLWLKAPVWLTAAAWPFKPLQSDLFRDTLQMSPGIRVKLQTLSCFHPVSRIFFNSSPKASTDFMVKHFLGGKLGFFAPWVMLPPGKAAKTLVKQTGSIRLAARVQKKTNGCLTSGSLWLLAEMLSNYINKPFQGLQEHPGGMAVDLCTWRWSFAQALRLFLSWLMGNKELNQHLKRPPKKSSNLRFDDIEDSAMESNQQWTQKTTEQILNLL